MKDLSFSYNWNNKLDNKAFTTIRLKQEKRFVAGEEFKIILEPKGKEAEIKGIAKIMDIKHFKLSGLNNFMSYIDTGYSKEECDKIIRRMYGKCDFEKQELSFILLKYN